MIQNRIAILSALLATGFTTQAQEVKVDALLIAGYYQMLNSNLRHNTLVPMVPGSTSYGYAYGGSKGSGTQEPMTENGFSIRRSEIYISGKINDQVSANVIFDPNLGSKTLLDACITWKPLDALEVKVGQFKPLQSYEATSVSAADLLFLDRSQFARRMGDARDRGIVVGYTIGDPDFKVKFSGGAFNGADRDNDANAQKDYVARVDFTLGAHKFGAYTLQGVTSKADKAISAETQAQSFGPNGPTGAEIYNNKDATSNYGAYYYADFGPLHVDAEIVMGLLGRRYPAFDETSAKRMHLDQKFLSHWVTGAYTLGHHTFALRYDFLTLNCGDDWYGTVNPYVNPMVDEDTYLAGDYSPNYTEATLGYIYALDPKLVRKANFKLDYIWRSKNFLMPRAGQVGEQGGDSIVAAFQVFL